MPSNMSQNAPNKKDYRTVDAAAWEPENDARFPLPGLARWTADDGAAAVFLQDLYVAHALWLDGKPPVACIEELDTHSRRYFGSQARHRVMTPFIISLRASIGLLQHSEAPWQRLSIPGQAVAVPGSTGKTAAALLVPPGCASVGAHLRQLRQQQEKQVRRLRFKERRLHRVRRATPPRGSSGAAAAHIPLERRTPASRPPPIRRRQKSAWLLEASIRQLRRGWTASAHRRQSARASRAAAAAAQAPGPPAARP